MMLYNGCIKFIRQSMIDMNEKNYESKNINIQKAQNIIQELMLTLNQELEISKQILPIYEFIIFQLRRSEEHTSELQSRGHLVCRLLLEKKKKQIQTLGMLDEDH